MSCGGVKADEGEDKEELPKTVKVCGCPDFEVAAWFKHTSGQE